MAYQVKVYVVQEMTREGDPGLVIAVKLTHQAAHQIARRHAPATVHFVVADKDDLLNVPDHGSTRGTSR